MVGRRGDRRKNAPREPSRRQARKKPRARKTGAFIFSCYSITTFTSSSGGLHGPREAFSLPRRDLVDSLVRESTQSSDCHDYMRRRRPSPPAITTFAFSSWILPAHTAFVGLDPGGPSRE